MLMLVGQDVGRASRPSDPQIRYGAGLWMAGCERAQRGGGGSPTRVELPVPTSTLARVCSESAVRCRAKGM